MKDMRIVLGGRTLPLYMNLERTDFSNEVDIVTLGGQMYTDFRNRLREWRISWSKIEEDSDAQIVLDLWAEQYDTGIYPMLQFDAYNIYCPVKITLAPTQRIDYNGTLIDVLSVTLREQNPVS